MYVRRLTQVYEENGTRNTGKHTIKMHGIWYWEYLLVFHVYYYFIFMLFVLCFYSVFWSKNSFYLRGLSHYALGRLLCSLTLVYIYFFVFSLLHYFYFYLLFLGQLNRFVRAFKWRWCNFFFDRYAFYSELALLFKLAATYLK